MKLITQDGQLANLAPEALDELKNEKLNAALVYQIITTVRNSSATDATAVQSDTLSKLRAWVELMDLKEVANSTEQHFDADSDLERKMAAGADII